MFQIADYSVAVYNDLQHEQFTGSASRFTLRKTSATNRPWMRSWDEGWLDTEDCLSFSIEANTATIEAVPTGLQLADGRKLQQGDTILLPSLMQLEDTWFEISHAADTPSLVPLQETSIDKLLLTNQDSLAGPSAATVSKWLTNAGQLHRAAAGSAQFYADAARFVVETVELDAAWVLRRQNDRLDDPWQIVGSHLPHPERGIQFNPTTLKTIINQSRAWYQPTDAHSPKQSEQAVVIAPVLDDEGQLIAAIYGVRDARGSNRRRGVRPLEARLVQLLAESVAVGIARLRQETEATRTQVLLEHAFSPTVAEYIQQHPECLTGQQREVTIMFADLRGYTTLAETMQLADCYELLSDVMETLTQIVVCKRGIVVDYYGDGLLALWNAPLEQPNHADLACSAAVEMFEALPAVSEKWKSRLNRPLELGIGIHTGPAYVGNAGTRSRIKYGPRGNTVNVASRVQTASKQLELPLVITASTQTKLSDKFFTLRVCTAKLPGLEKPAELFTAYPASEAAQVKSRLDQYTRALALFEAGAFDEAEQLLSELTSQGQATPAHFLAHYTAAQKNGNLGRRAVDKYAAQKGAVIEIFSK